MKRLLILLSFPCMILALSLESNDSQKVLHAEDFRILKNQIELLSQRLDDKEDDIKELNETLRSRIGAKEDEIKELKEAIEGQVNEEMM